MALPPANACKVAYAFILHSRTNTPNSKFEGNLVEENKT